MLEWLETLYFEQTTPDEVIIFLILWAGVALAAAFALYAVVILLLGSTQSRGKKVSPARLLFPSPGRLKENVVNYAVAGSTGLLLFLTVTAKHDLVQMVLDQPVSEVITEENVRRIFSLGGPTEADLVAAGAPEEIAEASAAALSGRSSVDAPTAGGRELATLTVEPVLRSLMSAGLPQNAGTFVELAVKSAEGRVELGFPDREQLLIAALLLLVGYALWFGWQRGRVAKAGKVGEPEHGEVVRHLRVPALCIPLLLVSAAAAGDIDRRVAESAAAVASIPLAEEAKETRWLTQFADTLVVRMGRQTPSHQIAGQVEVLDSLLQFQLREIDAWKDEQRDSLRSVQEAHDERFGGLERRFVRDSTSSQVSRQMLVAEVQEQRSQLEAREQNLDRLEGDVDLAQTLVDNLRDSVGQWVSRIEGRLSELDDRLPTTGLMFVVMPSPGQQGSRYQIRSGSAQGPLVAQGVGFGLHELPPRNYAVTGDPGMVYDTIVTVRAGHALTVRVRPVPTIGLRRSSKSWSGDWSIRTSNKGGLSASNDEAFVLLDL